MLSRYQHLIRPLNGLMAITLMVVIYIESGQALKVDLSSFPYQDKLMHALAYGVLATCMLFTFKPYSKGFTGRQQLIAIVLASLYGISDEWHQSFIPERTADIGDIVADAIGAFIAVNIVGRLSRRFYFIPE